MIRILAFSGSARTGSFNKLLLARAVDELVARGVETEIVDLRSLAIPIYDGDLEAASGRPEGAERLRAKVQEADGLLISSPEYNSSVPALLKNAIDWVSRPPGAQVFRGKVATLMGASTGPSGTLRMQPQLRGIGANLGMLVLPSLVTVSYAAKAFGEDGSLVDEGVRKQLTRAMDELVAECRLRKT